jgi:E2 binding domain
MVCNKTQLKLTVQKSDTLEKFIKHLKDEYRLLNPSIYSSRGILYVPKPVNIEALHRFKLSKTFQQLMEGGHISGDSLEEYDIMDPVIASAVSAKITISDEEMMQD